MSTREAVCHLIAHGVAPVAADWIQLVFYLGPSTSSQFQVQNSPAHCCIDKETQFTSNSCGLSEPRPQNPYPRPAAEVRHKCKTIIT